jgi:hypothetical protein
VTATVNGWRVITRAECVTIDVPGGRLPVHPKLAVIFTDLAEQWNATVHRLLWPGCWGWAEPRPIRGKTGGAPSNHGSGTAVDFSAPELPQGVAAGILMTQRELDAAHALIRRYQGVLAWGGDWAAPDTDAMHWEVAPGTSVEAVDALTAWLVRAPAAAPAAPTTDVPRETSTPQPSPAATPAGPGWTGPDLRGQSLQLRGEQGNNGPRVQAFQAFLARNYFYAREGLGPAGADGWWGPKTTAVLREWQARTGIPNADGANIGAQTARKLVAAGARL